MNTNDPTTLRTFTSFDDIKIGDTVIYFSFGDSYCYVAVDIEYHVTDGVQYPRLVLESIYSTNPEMKIGYRGPIDESTRCADWRLL